MARGWIRSMSLVLAAAPFAASLLIARDAPAGPPGPWVFIPPRSTSASAKPKTSASAAATNTPAPAGPEGMERARLATVVIERNKKPIALGILLSEKSVVVTARSPVVIGGAGDLVIRFPDTGVTTKVKLHHEDEAWDLALLVPASTKGTEGARASDADPLSPTATFSTFVLLKNGKVQSQATPVLGKRDYLSPDGEVLKDALSIETKNVAIGTALVDASGGVVGLVGRACAPGSNKPQPSGGKSACVPALFGTPLPVIRKFLKAAPPIKAPTPWLGIVGLTDKLGVRIIQVQEGSPAALAGLKAGDPATADSVLAVDGVLVKTSEELAEQVKKKAPGDEIKMLVTRAGAVREVKIVLKSADEAGDASKPTAPPPVSPTNVTPLPPLPTVFAPPKAKLNDGIY